VIDAYGEILDAELAPYSDGSYFATVAGHSFSGVWGRDYDGECVFTVTIDAGYDEQVFEFTCYDSPCRAASGEAAVAEGTLTWEVAEWIPIARRTVDGCLHEFCGDCGCAPPKICVTVNGEDCTASGIFPFSGELNGCGEATTVEYDFSLVCGSETISGTVSLQRNEYTDACELVIAVDGYDPHISATPCAVAGSASVPPGYTISVTEAPCEVCRGIPCADCDCGLQHPYTGTIYLTIVPRADCCQNMAGVHSFVFIGYETNDLGECEIRFQGTVNDEIFVYSCQGGLFSQDPGPGNDLFIPPSLEPDSTCEPFFLHWVIPGVEAFFGRCDPACIDEEESPIDIYLTR
jgi:hypothetical protein